MADVASTSFSDEECLKPASNAPKRPRSRALFEDVTNKEDSLDSFDSFDSPQKKQVPTKRSPALITTKLEDAASKDSFDSFDSFDSPPTKKSRISPKKRSPDRIFPLESGVPGFPALYDLEGVTLSVQSATVSEGQVILDCIDLKTHQQSFAYLQDQWAELSIVAGDTIRLFDAKRWQQNDWIVDAEHGVIITQPDTLISATSVSQALFCQRNSVLGDRFRGGTSKNKKMPQLVVCLELALAGLPLDPAQRERFNMAVGLLRLALYYLDKAANQHDPRALRMATLILSLNYPI